MHFILIALVLSALDGSPTSWHRVGEPFATPEECVTAQMNQPPEHVVDSYITVYSCVREDALHESTT